jgi:uncharacterized glyoxalase superfamily protein PhnB
MSDLENLRKQAKTYVRWHRERRWTVAEVIRTTLPRFAERSDREVLDSRFRLADAQELVARRAGFDRWESLVAACREPDAPGEAPESEPTDSPRVLVARPFVFVRDVGAACAYYVEALGFDLAFDYGRPPFYAEIERDGVRLCVRQTDDPLIDPALARREDIMVASLEVDDARALYQELQARGAVFSQKLRVEPYGTRGFVVDDPDGNRVLFFDSYGQPPRRSPPARADEA